jgi:DNA-binding transcriptional MerR regulator
MTFLSVKQRLRHYHDLGLLELASVDPSTGDRHYTVDQVPTAQVIRRFRDLWMPLEELRAVLTAPDVDARNAAIVAHLQDGDLVAQDQDFCGLHLSSRRDSRSHTATLVIRRKTNGRHMTCDHHDRTAGRQLCCQDHGRHFRHAQPCHT